MTGAEWESDTAGVRLRELAELAELREVFQLYQDIWQFPPDEAPVTVEMLRVLAHTGNYVLGAFDGDRLIGACVGLLAEPAGQVLHSHVAGVSAAARGRSVGLAMKQHQRAWALARGLDTISWTFDPLIRRNAHFNLTKLGALPVRYLVDFYGPMGDSVNGSDPSDRLLVHWPVDAADFTRPGPPLDAAVVLDERDGWPVAVPSSADTVLVRVPADVERLRVERPEAASRWRIAVRETLGGLIDGGAAVTGFHRDGGYVVSRNVQHQGGQ